MKLLRMFRYGLRDAFKSVHRNLSLSMASILCISITLLIVAFSLTLSFNVKGISKNIKDDITMQIYLNFGVNEDQVIEFEESLNKMDNVLKDWKKATPTERKNELVQDDNDEDGFWQSVLPLLDNENEVFHYYYEIKVHDITKINDTAKEIKELPEVYYVEYGESWVNQMISMFNVIEKIAFIIVLILIVVTIFLIVNTIKLTIFSRKREISIMRVVGASNWTIKNPFIIEGFLIGVMGSIVPILITIYGYTAFYNSLDDGHLYSSIIEVLRPAPFVYIISLVILVLGALVGMIGSGRAVRRYLKV